MEAGDNISMTISKFPRITALLTLILAVPGSIVAVSNIYNNHWNPLENVQPVGPTISQDDPNNGIVPSNRPEKSPIEEPIQNIHNNIITVNGVGVLDTNIKNVNQRLYLGKRAARADAKRQITEILGLSLIHI